MTTQTIVNSKPQAQVSALQLWDKLSESAPDPQSGVINPSRNITKDDEAYLRDYTLAAAVISWDEGTFGTSLQVTAGDITNIAIASDTVWYQINLHRAVPLDIETFRAHRLWIQLYKAELEVAEECQQQPIGFAGDSVSCQLQPTQSAYREFDQGHCHGRQDASERLHPMYTEPSSEYAAGYLAGYNSIFYSCDGNSNCDQRPEVIQPAGWSVRLDSRWGLYQVWVGNRCIALRASLEEAEAVAQSYIATEQIVQRQNQAVIAAYAW